MMLVKHLKVPKWIGGPGLLKIMSAGVIILELSA